MKEKINIDDYAGVVTGALSKGLLLNTQGEKFNSMVIGWGHLGRIWNEPTFVVYVRESRYTKKLLDASGEFSISVPLGAPDPKIFRVCGTQSGRDVDKIKEAGLTLEAPEVIGTPSVREYPLALECQVLYSQKQDLPSIPDELKARFYPADFSRNHDNANDPHTAYIGRIVAAYMIK